MCVNVGTYDDVIYIFAIIREKERKVAITSHCMQF